MGSYLLAGADLLLAILVTLPLILSGLASFHSFAKVFKTNGMVDGGCIVWKLKI